MYSKQIEYYPPLLKKKSKKGNNRLSPFILSTLQKKGYVEIKEKISKTIDLATTASGQNVAHFERSLKLNQEQALALINCISTRIYIIAY